MKKRKIIVAAVVVFLLLALSAVFIKTNHLSQTVTVHGQLKAKFHFQKSEVAGAKKWMDMTQQLALVNIDKSIESASDASQKSMLQKTKKNLQSISNRQLLTINSDGTADLNNPLPDIQVTIDGKTVTTDRKGNYKIKGVHKGKKDIKLSFHSQVMAESTKDISSDTTVNFVSTMTSKDVTKTFDSSGDMSGAGLGVGNPDSLVKAWAAHLENETPVKGSNGS